jgi:CheY-like chemotaxis protein
MPRATILVVDDTPEARSLVTMVLDGQGYQMVEACDGTEGWEACQRINGEIDLLLTDIEMPQMDGLELAATVTASYPAIRVLVISGQCAESAMQERLSEKGFAFLPKPFLPKTLIDAVEQILTPAKRPPEKAPASRPQIRDMKTG